MSVICLQLVLLSQSGQQKSRQRQVHQDPKSFSTTCSSSKQSVRFVFRTCFSFSAQFPGFSVESRQARFSINTLITRVTLTTSSVGKYIVNLFKLLCKSCYLVFLPSCSFQVVNLGFTKKLCMLYITVHVLSLNATT